MDWNRILKALPLAVGPELRQQRSNPGRRALRKAGLSLALAAIACVAQVTLWKTESELFSGRTKSAGIIFVHAAA